MVSEKEKKNYFFWEEDKGKLLNFCMFLKGIGKTSDVCERERKAFAQNQNYRFEICTN